MSNLNSDLVFIDGELLKQEQTAHTNFSQPATSRHQQVETGGASRVRNMNFPTAKSSILMTDKESTVTPEPMVMKMIGSEKGNGQSQIESNLDNNDTSVSKVDQ